MSSIALGLRGEAAWIDESVISWRKGGREREGGRGREREGEGGREGGREREGKGGREGGREEQREIEDWPVGAW